MKKLYITPYGSRKYKGKEHWEYDWVDKMGRTFRGRIGMWAKTQNDIIQRFELGKRIGKFPKGAKMINIKKVR